MLLNVHGRQDGKDVVLGAGCHVFVSLLLRIEWRGLPWCETRTTAAGNSRESSLCLCGTGDCLQL
ncbi:hypothetical protein BCR44DRAFT_1439183, partial [Catenaria anguillulae PL171]